VFLEHFALGQTLPGTLCAWSKLFLEHFALKSAKNQFRTVNLVHTEPIVHEIDG